MTIHKKISFPGIDGIPEFKGIDKTIGWGTKLLVILWVVMVLSSVAFTLAVSTAIVMAAFHYFGG